ncbi:class Ib ribonucleoside-diphosphate reductase assembly flavoprotein NrdI [Corynebacterium pyruviciproducens]|uniref:Class Ib ribonucleoside-diphosphate reductase assembly flavoprotein NrdI n=1 Tax=Corynebacterium pyruviciproducens TaxID=598660 RepID=A0AAF0YTW6_9CORY|nr:class Ib ribonucleoside-diphosphate reductase assembly flavoprotein NrdI [Corynebacterium pyruviciproducens]WOT03415.1 class Ib ribonucleoside-diphosphate reductase assembly flavoprotein NrdI [Corynebacterium pyruviciproducens]
MTKLLYYSRTGTTARIMKSFEGAQSIENYNGEGEYILTVPSYCAPRTGQYVPKPVKQFLAEHYTNMVGVIGVGNSVFGHEFCLGSRRIAEHYHVPTVTEIDMALTKENILDIERAVNDNLLS